MLDILVSRPLWRSYTRCTDGIIFVVDSAEQDKLDEAKVELWRTMKYQDNKDIPLLILANKQDLQTALSSSDIEDALGIDTGCFIVSHFMNQLTF